MALPKTYIEWLAWQKKTVAIMGDDSAWIPYDHETKTVQGMVTVWNSKKQFRVDARDKDGTVIERIRRAFADMGWAEIN